MEHRVVMQRSVFPAPADAVWERLQHLSTLQYIAAPFASFAPLNDAGGLRWQEGGTYQFRFRLFCLFPLGVHTIHMIRFQKAGYVIETEESNPHVPVWDHRILLKELAPDRTEYTDQVELCAGWKTPFVWLWAKCFYAHRQKKWRKLL